MTESTGAVAEAVVRAGAAEGRWLRESERLKEARGLGWPESCWDYKDMADIFGQRRPGVSERLPAGLSQLQEQPEGSALGVNPWACMRRQGARPLAARSAHFSAKSMPNLAAGHIMYALAHAAVDMGVC